MGYDQPVIPYLSRCTLATEQENSATRPSAPLYMWKNGSTCIPDEAEPMPRVR